MADNDSMPSRQCSAPGCDQLHTAPLSPPQLCALTGCEAPETRHGLCAVHNAAIDIPMLVDFADTLISLIEHTDQDAVIMAHNARAWLTGEDNAHDTDPLRRLAGYALQVAVLLAVPGVLERAVRALKHELWGLANRGSR